MANPIRDFFRKHHAVPSSDSGPSWSRIDDAGLLRWLQYCRRLVVRGLMSVDRNGRVVLPSETNESMVKLACAKFDQWRRDRK